MNTDIFKLVFATLTAVCCIYGGLAVWHKLDVHPQVSERDATLNTITALHETVASLSKKLDTLETNSRRESMDSKVESLQKRMDAQGSTVVLLTKKLKTHTHGAYDSLTEKLDTLSKVLNSRTELLSSMLEALQKNMDARSESLDSKVKSLQNKVAVQEVKAAAAKAAKTAVAAAEEATANAKDKQKPGNATKHKAAAKTAATSVADKKKKQEHSVPCYCAAEFAHLPIPAETLTLTPAPA